MAFFATTLAAAALLAAGAGDATIAPAAPAGEEARVQVGGRTAFFFQVPRGGLSARLRAQRASTALRSVVEEKALGPVEVEYSEGAAVFRVADRQLFALTDADAAAAGDPSLARFVEHRKQALGTFLSRERRRGELQRLALSVSLTVFLGFVSVLLMRYVRRSARRLRAWTESPYDPKDPSAARRFLSEERIRWLVVILVHGAHFFAQAAVVYLFLVGTFSLFESTAPWREQLTAWVVAPFRTVAERVSTGVPTLLLVFLFLLLIHAGWHAIGVASDRLWRGQVPGRPVSPEMIAPTRLLLRVGLVVGALLLLAPLLTGESAGLFARVGFGVLVVVGLALLPLLATVALGVSAILGRRYRLGDWYALRDGTRPGRACAVDFFHLCLASEEGEELLVPHLLALVRPLRRLPGPPPLRAELRVPSPLAPADALFRLRAAAEAFAAERGLAEPPAVVLAELRPGLALFRVEVPGASERLRSELLLALASALGDHLDRRPEEARLA